METQPLDNKYFLTQPDEDFICIICDSVMMKPHSCQDGHSFCYDCITLWLRTNHTCPCDRKLLTISTLTCNRSLNSLIMKHKVWCRNHNFEEGVGVVESEKNINRGDCISTGTGIPRKKCFMNCNWMGCLGELESHLAKDCEQMDIKCGFEDCNVTVKRRFLDDHKEHCKCRPIECPYCKIEIQFKSKYIHFRSCDKAPEVCEWECGAVIEKGQREEHHKVCPLALVNCSYGCMTKVHRQDLPKHISDCVTIHMDYMLQKVNKTEIDNIALRNKVFELEREKSALVINSELRLQQMQTLSRKFDASAASSAAALHANVSRLENGYTKLKEDINQLKLKQRQRQSTEINLSWRLRNINALKVGRRIFSSPTASVYHGGHYEFKIAIERNETGNDVSIYIQVYGTFLPIDIEDSSITLEHPTDEYKNLTREFIEDNSLVDRSGQQIGFDSFVSFQECTNKFRFPDGSLRITASVLIGVESIHVKV